MLYVDNIVSGYGKLEVLHGVSVHVKQKEIRCIIGPNGSGKSTLFKTIMGLVKAKKGKVILEGEDITNLRPDIILSKGVSMIPQGRIIFPRMSVLENLKMGAYSIRQNRDLVEDRLEEVFEIFPRLKEKRKQLASTLSGGEQMMLCIGRSLMLRPKVLLIDEPSLGLEPKIVEQVYQLIKDINRSQGIPIMIVEQNVRKALSVADYVYVLDLGKNKFEGPPDVFLKSDKLVKLYLGS